MQKYRQDSRAFLAQARSELAQGDVRQASEKGWGAAAQIVKAVAEQRGWLHCGHAQLFDAVAILAQEAGDDDIDRLFELASALQPTSTKTGTAPAAWSEAYVTSKRS